jgi:hypothetical protein
MSEDAKTKKLLEAMERDERLVDETISKLVTARNRPLNVRIKSPGSEDIVIQSRRLRASELAFYRREIFKISPELAMGKSPEEIGLTPEQIDKINELCDEVIERGIGIPKARFRKEIDDERIRFALAFGILSGSSASKQEVEDASKFRGDA